MRRRNENGVEEIVIWRSGVPRRVALCVVKKCRDVGVDVFILAPKNYWRSKFACWKSFKSKCLLFFFFLIEKFTFVWYTFFFFSFSFWALVIFLYPTLPQLYIYNEFHIYMELIIITDSSRSLRSVDNWSCSI